MNMKLYERIALTIKILIKNISSLLDFPAIDFNDYDREIETHVL